MPRLFIAAPLPESTKRQIELVIAPLRQRLPLASWTRAESFHLTFAFLGEQDEAIVDPLGDELSRHLRDQVGFEVVVAGCGFFPNPRRPRVAWVGLQPEEALKRTALSVREALRARKIDFDEKTYVPHLTLARLRQRWTDRDVHQFREALEPFSSEPARVDSVILYQSQLSSKGAIHTPLRTFPLSF